MSAKYVHVNKSLVLDNSLSDRARMVYVLIAADESYPYIAIEEIAKIMGIYKGTIYKYVNELVVSGWLTRRIIRNNGRILATVYELKNEKA